MFQWNENIISSRPSQVISLKNRSAIQESLEIEGLSFELNLIINLQHLKVFVSLNRYRNAVTRCHCKIPREIEAFLDKSMHEFLEISLEEFLTKFLGKFLEQFLVVFACFSSATISSGDRIRFRSLTTIIHYKFIHFVRKF